MYNKINEIKNNNNLYNKLKEIIEIEDPEKMIKRKFTYTNAIMEKELNKIEYIDFAYKVTFLNLIKKHSDEQENTNIEFIEKLHKILENFKNKIVQDKLKIFEKILLIIELNFCKLEPIKFSDLQYFHKDKIDIESPLYTAFQFLIEFIKDLNYQSNFYFPLLCIDRDIFYETHKFGNSKDYNETTYKITTYGFNMNSLTTIKNHLSGIMPNIILYMDYQKEDESNLNSYTGLVTLYNVDFQGIKIDKKMEDEKQRRHYGFLIARKLFHEVMGHKNSLINKFGLNFISPISFKNKGIIKFIYEDNKEYQYCNLKDAIKEGISIKDCCGDSGYLLEFYFGQINDYSITSIIDFIKDSTNLSDLLDSRLWHFNIDQFSKKVYCKYLSVYFKIDIKKDLCLDDQVEYLEGEALKKLKDSKEYNKNEKEDNSQANSNKSHKGKKIHLFINNALLKDNPFLKKIKTQKKEKEKK